MTSLGSSPIKRRAPKACHECHRRKVRCDVSLVGQPCANCALYGVSCEIAPRKRRRQQKKNSVSPARRESTSQIIVNDSSSRTLDEDDGQNADALAAGVQAVESASSDKPTSIYYSGNTHGAIGFVATLVDDESTQTAAHYLVPQGVRKSKGPEDLEYLRIKGAFSIPSKTVCDALVRVYFFHVHPLLPIIDATSFLTQYTTHGCRNVNLLLLWSMFLSTANFVDRETLQLSEYSSRKALKRAAYQRAKVLYDNAYDEDQITVIQSVILMAHWYEDAEDRFEAWHWTGIAISLCQTVGLHCDRKSSTKKRSALSESRERLCRRIWWSCVVRDRSLSMVMGRPLRIRLEDGDLSEASIEDMHYDLRQLPDPLREEYFPCDLERVSTFWCQLVEISVILGNILCRNANANGATFTGNNSTEPSMSDLKHCDWLMGDVEGLSPLEMLCAHHNRLSYYATCIAFWRPFIFSSTEDRQFKHARRQEAIERARAAAVKSNAVLEEIMSRDMLKYVKVQTISALVPSMQIHLLDCKGPTTTVRILGENRFQLCMQALTQLKETWWGAEFALKLFQRAHESVVQRVQRRANQTNHTARNETQQPSPSSAVATTAPAFNTSTPDSSIFSADEYFIPGFDFENFPDIELMWGDMDTNDSMLNAFLSADEFSAGIP